MCKNCHLTSSITEKDFLNSLSDQEPFSLIVSFQQEKRKYLKSFLECLEQQLEQLEKEPEIDFKSFQDQRANYWKLHIH